MLIADLQGQDLQGQDLQGQDLQGQDPQGQDLKGLGPVGQVRIYLGSAHRFIWPVHLAGWLELGWTTEPGVTPVATPRATPTVTSAPRKKRASSSSIEANPTNESPYGASSSGASPVGVSSATAVEPLPVLVTDFLVDPSVPTDA